MQLFTIHDILNAAWIGATAFWELKGTLSHAALGLVFLPFHEFSIPAAFVAVVWAYILWKNKGLLFSDVLHVLHVSEWLMQVLRLGSR